MNLFKVMTLKWKLITGFSIPVLLIVALSALVYQSTNSMADSAKWVNHTHEAVAIGNKLGSAMVDMETGLRGYIIAGKEAFLEPYVAGQQAFEQTMDKGLSHVSDNPTQIKRLQKVESLKDQWLAVHAKKAIQMRASAGGSSSGLQKKPDQGIREITEFVEEGHGKKRMDEIRQVLQSFIDAEQGLIAIRSDEAASIAKQTSNIAIFGAMFSACLALIITYAITGSIVGPVSAAGKLADSIMQGNLNNNVDTSSKDEFGELMLSLEAMQDKLRSLVGDISTSADSVLDSSNEISRGNNSLSERTEKQASSLEQTAASMEEMTAAVKLSANHADEANTLATGARQQAERGSAVVSKAVTAMGEINSSSSKIADIIAVIDEIAFQTNLLALNAAVEAARAGEQGRGFAVVATEVRNLAQRSATSAKEIKDLIQDSVSKVEEGSKLVFESGQTLDEIVNSVAKVSDIVAEITTASQEQRTGIEQVNTAVVYIDEMTQQNSAMVEEAAAASETMTEQAKNLNQLVSYFSLQDKYQSRAS